REKKIAVARLATDHQSILNPEYKWHQVRECLMDPQPWLLACNALLQCLQGGGLLAVLLTGMGYSSKQSALMSMLGNTIQPCSVIFWSTNIQMFRKV
ncbi:MAG: hypothetical protein FE78DRAFT_142877, partial [Acidomyces sp. 'richmondensis']